MKSQYQSQNQSLNQSLNQRPNPSSSQSPNPSPNQSKNQSPKRGSNQNLSHSSNQGLNPSTNPNTTQAQKQPVGRSGHKNAPMGSNLHKLAAVAQIKWLCISRNTMIMLGPVIVIAMVYGCKILYGINSEGTIVPFLTGFLLNLGITMNICSEGFIMVGTSIAEEKENHTLRVLMTSSVTGMQYFIGSILIPFVMLMAVNYIVLFISGISLEVVPWLSFFLVSMVASLTSCVLGMIVGICARNQMNANLIAYPFLMVFMMVPVFGSMSEGLHRISGFLFTGVMTGMTECLADGERYVMSPLDIAVLFGELLISVLVFLVLYKRNGYEKD